MMRLHWSPKSPYVRKVMVCADELGLLPQLTLVRTVAAMQKPNASLMQDNPLSKIPTLVLADGRVLFDSAVICEYLDDLRAAAQPAAATLFPKQGAAKWQAQRWHAFGDGLLDILILWRNERERVAPLPPLLASFQLRTEASLRQLDSEARALADAPLGIGQIAVGCMLGYLDYRFDALGWRQLAPQLGAWFAEIGGRKSFQATVPVDG